MSSSPAGGAKILLAAAPIAGFSNRASREIMRGHGADIAYGEMVSARALAYGNRRTLELFDIQGEPSPRVVQICGSDPQHMAAAACFAVEAGAERIDINMGCPVPKVVKNGEGCSLMLKPRLAAELVRAALSAGRPVSCKFRSGWDEQNLNAVDFARRLQRAGATLLAVHARSRRQMYGGQADWRIIAQVKQAVDVPVAGNGDVFSAADALALLAATGCDQIMVGRGMLGNPWLFADIRCALEGREPPGRPAPQIILSTALRHLKRHIERGKHWLAEREGRSRAEREGEELALRAMRAHLGWYTKGLRNSAALRLRLNQAVSYAEVESLFASWLCLNHENGQ